MNKFQKKLLLWLLLLALLSPLGIILPVLFKGGDAWGEWDTETIDKLIGFIPRGMEKLSNFWQSIFTDYTNVLGENLPLSLQIISYIISAIIGSAIIYIIVILILKLYKYVSKTP